MNTSDVDAAIGYVNKIIDNVRCATCDKLEGLRMRYPCGHSACDDCVIYAEDCQICTPPSQSSETGAKPDRPMTIVVENARGLLKACQNLFDVNAFQHKRLSEQLKIEKELFPKCIQAPVKYENKRKSTNFSIKNKENLSTYFPGEATSTPKVTKMDDSVNYVQQWLNKNEKNISRKPFTDLNVNTQWVNVPKSKNIKQNVIEDIHSQRACRKRTHFKTTVKDYSHTSGNKKSVRECVTIPSKIKKETTSYLQENIINDQKCDNDESGIFMDNEPIVIDGSQETFIDKDKKAWLAVLEACKNETYLSTSLVNYNQVNITNDSSKLLNKPNEIKQIIKVPFFKKSAILETCNYCKNEMNLAKPVPVTSQSKPVKITIDTDNFLTTITVFKDAQNAIDHNKTNNISIQTDNQREYTIDNATNCDVNDCNKNNIYREMQLVDDKSIVATDKQSEDLFADNRKIFENIYQKEKTNKCIVIEESDSDTDLELSGPVCVKADVHRSCQELEYGTLSEIENVKRHESKPRRGPRGHTPTSTDSSEKENYNPNRIRRHNSTEKKKSRKK